jgi:acyl-CoA thioester hydrolase
MAYKIKIYYHHTDCGGVVYYANYLHFLEEARTEFLSQRGINIKELIQRGEFFVVSRQALDYKSPAGYGDTLEVTTHLVEVTGVRINLEHQIRKNGQVLVAEAQTTLAFVGRDFRPRPIPAEMREKIEKV